jgi:hypothetical protein
MIHPIFQKQRFHQLLDGLITPKVSKETEEAPEEKDDSESNAKEEEEEISTGNSLAGIAYRYSQDFDL